MDIYKEMGGKRGGEMIKIGPKLRISVEETAGDLEKQERKNTIQEKWKNSFPLKGFTLQFGWHDRGE